MTRLLPLLNVVVYGVLWLIGAVIVYLALTTFFNWLGGNTVD